MADESDQIGENEIEQLLEQAQAAAPQSHENSAESAAAGAEAGAAAGTAQAVGTPADSTADAQRTPSSSMGDDIQLLFEQAQNALASVDSPAAGSLPHVEPFQLHDFAGTPATTEKATLDLLRDVELDLKIELGRTHMELEEVLKLRKGSVVPLDKLAGDPVDIYANGRLIARGEVLVLNDSFCVRVAELITGDSV